MYEQLLNADVVVADVSTYNANAFYELGVRHAPKPYTTITIAEDKLVFPFDVGQIALRTYHHLGEGNRFRGGGADARQLDKRDHDCRQTGAMRQPRVHVSAWT
jgi:hypothetical protein